MVYQGYGQNGDRAAIATLSALLGLVPDLTLVLDVGVATSVARMRARGAAADRYERLGEGFFARVRAGFLAVAAADPQRCAVIGAEEATEAVAASVWQAVGAKLRPDG